MGRCLEWTSGLGKRVTALRNNTRQGNRDIVHQHLNVRKQVCSANAAMVRIDARACSESERPRFANPRPVSYLCSALSLVVLVLATSDCGTRHATLNFTAPSTATAGIPFTVTVTVMIGSDRDTIIDNRVHFASSDPDAVLPAEYYFTRSDAGSHTWTNGFILKTPGSQTISGKIIEATGINGSTNVAVAP
jgi:hypothetical protein